MKGRRVFPIVPCVLGMALLVLASASAAADVPVIYCTDLFHPPDDPDDHFDLAVLFAMPELDLKAVILDQGEKQRQRPGAIPVSQMNWIAGRQVPVALGLAHALESPVDQALGQPAAFQQGVQFILTALRESPVPVRIATVGSVRDLVAAYNRAPELCQKKLDRVLVFLGESSDPHFREYNVGLDPHAYVGLLRSELPIWWVPCFDGGPWQNRGHASYWKASHRDLLERAAPEVIQYFIYALEKETADPIPFLSAPVDAARKETLLRGDRNLWCTAVFEVLTWPAGKTENEIFRFSAVRLDIDNDAVIRYHPGPESRQVMRFEVRDRPRYGPAMTQATARWLERLPAAPHARTGAVDEPRLQRAELLRLRPNKPSKENVGVRSGGGLSRNGNQTALRRVIIA